MGFDLLADHSCWRESFRHTTFLRLGRWDPVPTGLQAQERRKKEKGRRRDHTDKSTYRTKVGIPFCSSAATQRYGHSVSPGRQFASSHEQRTRPLSRCKESLRSSRVHKRKQSHSSGSIGVSTPESCVRSRSRATAVWKRIEVVRC